MQRRRERIERWRAERKKKEQEATKKETQKTIIQGTVKKWSLEDDSEDEEKNEKPEKDENGKEEVAIDNNETMQIEENQETEEEMDPLDEYMKGVQAEVKKINKIDVKKNNMTDAKTTSLVIVTGIAKSKVSKNKGELIEQNQDGLEYSSEEEQEDLKDTAANIANKQKKELAKIDHNYIHYADFRKNFYVEVPEIAKMTHEEVDAYKEELEGIRVKGKYELFKSFI